MRVATKRPKGAWKPLGRFLTRFEAIIGSPTPGKVVALAGTLHGSEAAKKVPGSPIFGQA